MTPIEDHPMRYALANELHARPFPVLDAPCHVAFLAIKRVGDAANRNRADDRAHLLELLDRFGAQHPQPDATHFFGPMGKHKLKWESHTEFVTYTVFSEGVTDRPFDPRAFEVFPADWLSRAPGRRITSALIRMETVEAGEEADKQIAQRMNDWFVADSLACSNVLDGSAVMASDFRIDSAGHMRFALFIRPGTGARRVGRIAQRVTEIETYKAMAMLGLPRAQKLSRRMAEIDTQLAELVGDMTGGQHRPEETLKALLGISAELESMMAQAAFRFGATGAYEALVNQRIEVMREERFQNRQTFREFMMRRFDPAMRTAKATERRLENMTARATRAGELLRTQVDVDRSAQNQKILRSMDQRADMQLRLQETVEGLSVVAISYYAVSLVGYMAYPLAEPTGLGKGMLTAIITPPVVLVVWLLIRRIRRRIH
ncbi:MAG: DUF3422 domain-containing protein [Paracoccaceae bacterium]